MIDALIRVFGHLGNDPEMRYMPSGKAVTNFSVASARKWKDANGQDLSETTWFRCSTFEKSAENCHTYLHKGSYVCFEGRLIVDPKTGGPKIWTRQDGGAGANFEVSITDIKFLTPKGSGESNGDGSSNNGAAEFDPSNSQPEPAAAGPNTDSDGFPL